MLISGSGCGPFVVVEGVALTVATAMLRRRVGKGDLSSACHQYKTKIYSLIARVESQRS